jgi:hypothetical protein
MTPDQGRQFDLIGTRGMSEMPKSRIVRLRIAILTPEHPNYVAPRRHYRREIYFKRDELSRLVREAMRDTDKPLAAGEIAAKRFADAAHLAVTKMIVARLGVLAKRGELAKNGRTRDARWAST